jgi:hypothetical protein
VAALPLRKQGTQRLQQAVRDSDISTTLSWEEVGEGAVPLRNLEGLEGSITLGGKSWWRRKRIIRG